MISAQGSPVLPQLRRLALGAGGEVSDSQLLAWFVQNRDEAAFAALVRRHGPMVMGVCRRLLRDWHDAEDAFQATFLVLVRKAPGLAQTERLGSWLYGVAVFTARNALVARNRRRAVEQQVRAAAEATIRECAPEPDWHPLLDEELKRLPERYRVPLILCALEGRSRRTAARELGWSEGTLSSRLARGRELLRKRLQRRGVPLPAAGLFTLLTTQTACAVPPALAAVTLDLVSALAAGHGAPLPPAAAALMKGVLRAMFLTKLKIATLWLLLAGMLGTGVTLFASAAFAGKPTLAPSQEQKGNKPPEDARPTLQGILQEVDPAKRTLTLVWGDKGNRQEKTVTISKDVKVLLHEGKNKNDPPQEGSLANLAAGQSVTLYLSTDSKTVETILPTALRLSGTVQRVDLAKRTLTLKVKDNKGAAERTVRFEPETRVLLNDGLDKNDPDTEGKLADLSEGTHVTLQMALADKDKAIAVRIQGGGLRGELKGIDAGNNTLTLVVKEDAQVVDKTLNVARNARIEGGLAGLTPGTTVHVRLSVFDKTQVVAVNPEKNKREKE